MGIASPLTRCGWYSHSCPAAANSDSRPITSATKPRKKRKSRETNIPTATIFGRLVAYQPRPLSYSPHFQSPLQIIFLDPPSAEQSNLNEMAVQLWETLKEAISAYTGLSPTTFFTLLAVGLAVYYVVSGLFGSSSDDHHRRPRDFSQEQMEPLPPTVQLGEVTEEELALYDGKDPKKPLLMAIKGQIYDVSQSRMFYGPGGPYALFAGKDASRALAKMSFEEKDLTGDISGLGPFELDALQDWEYKFTSKYVKVGTIKKTVPLTEGSSSEAVENTERDVPNQAENGPSSETSDLREEEAPSASKADE